MAERLTLVLDLPAEQTGVEAVRRVDVVGHQVHPARHPVLVAVGSHLRRAEPVVVQEIHLLRFKTLNLTKIPGRSSARG